MHIKKLFLLTFISLTLVSGRAFCQSMKVLFIGNSYTYLQGVKPSLPTAIKKLAEANGRRMEVEMQTLPMIPLRTHLKLGRAVKAIQKGGWDIVVLQENANHPVFQPDTMLESVKRFDEEIKKTGAKTFLYLTWELTSRPGTEKRLNRSYYDAAKAVGATVVPVGPAWRLYERRFGDLVFRQDDFSSHATPAGAFLAALTFYSRIFGEMPKVAPENLFEDLQLTATQEQNLLSSAWEVTR